MGVAELREEFEFVVDGLVVFGVGGDDALHVGEGLLEVGEGLRVVASAAVVDGQRVVRVAGVEDGLQVVRVESSKLLIEVEAIFQIAVRLFDAPRVAERDADGADADLEVAAGVHGGGAVAAVLRLVDLRGLAEEFERALEVGACGVVALFEFEEESPVFAEVPAEVAVDAFA